MGSIKSLEEATSDILLTTSAETGGSIAQVELVATESPPCSPPSLSPTPLLTTCPASYPLPRLSERSLYPLPPILCTPSLPPLRFCQASSCSPQARDIIRLRQAHRKCPDMCGKLTEHCYVTNSQKSASSCICYIKSLYWEFFEK